MEPPSSIAQITWDEHSQPRSAHFNDIYFSKSNGLAETHYVFIEQNKLPSRWSHPLNNATFTIAETGFGTGLNFLATWNYWRQQRPLIAGGNCAQLHFISVEKFPLSRQDLQKSLALWPSLTPLAQQLIDHYPPQPINGVFRLLFDDANVSLTLYFGDASEGFQQFIPSSTLGRPAADKTLLFGEQTCVIDAWFLDGFAPAKNPEMWTPKLFHAMAQLSGEQTTFATFTVAGIVRRGLQDVGFNCQKVPGFGSKREMLCGTFIPKTHVPSRAQHTPPRGGPAHHYWHLQRTNPTPPRQAIVIGGGLAGCHAAHALAQRGIQVTLLEQHASLATEASGNQQGVVYTRLSPHNDPLSQFNLAAQIYASHFYSRNESGFQRCGQQCGVIHLAATEKQKDHYQRLAKRFQKDGFFCQWLSAEEASLQCGVEVSSPGLMIPSSGWLSPPDLCESLVQHPGIKTRFNASVSALRYDKDTWQALDANNQPLASSRLVVIANAHAARQFEQTALFPLKQIRGQITHVVNNPTPLKNLRTVLCGDGYIPPAHKGILCFGATFNLESTQTILSREDQQTNVLNVKRMVACENDAFDDLVLDGRVGFRTTTPDYFPMVGPVPNPKNIHAMFAPLQHQANAPVTNPGSYYPGLYTMLGMGSRGLAYAPLTAELLASLICGNPLPLHQSLYLKLQPSRFLIRDLIRNKRSTL